MIAAHTPGPWTVLFNHMGQDSITAEDCCICDMPGWDADYSEEETANARLIATAPELLDVAKKIRAYGTISSSWIDELDAAIAKATGAQA